MITGEVPIEHRTIVDYRAEQEVRSLKSSSTSPSKSIEGREYRNLIVMPDRDKNNNHNHNHHDDDDDDDDSDSNHRLDSMTSASALMAATTLANWSSPAAQSNSGSDIDIMDGNSCTTIDLSNHLKRKDVFNVRKQREFIPDNKKDESYWDRRRRNNEAAKRSREKRRLNDMVLESRVFELTKENTYLRAQLMAIRDKYGIVGETLVSSEQSMSTNENQVALNLTKRAKLLSPLMMNTGSLTSNGHVTSPSPVPLRSLVIHHHHQQSPGARAIISTRSSNTSATTMDQNTGKSMNGVRYHQVDYGHEYWPIKSEDHKQHGEHYQHHESFASLQRDARRLHNGHNDPEPRHLESQSPIQHDCTDNHVTFGSRTDYEHLNQSTSPIALTVGSNADYQHDHHHHHHHNQQYIAGQIKNDHHIGSQQRHVSLVMTNSNVVGHDLDCCSNESDDDNDEDNDERRMSIEINESPYITTNHRLPQTSVTCDGLQQLHLPHKLRHKPRLSECSMVAATTTTTTTSGHQLLVTTNTNDFVNAPSSLSPSLSPDEQRDIPKTSSNVETSSIGASTTSSSTLKVENSQLKMEMKRLAVEVANLKDMLIFNKNKDTIVNPGTASSNKSDTSSSSRDSGFATDGEPEREQEVTNT